MSSSSSNSTAVAIGIAAFLAVGAYISMQSASTAAPPAPGPEATAKPQSPAATPPSARPLPDQAKVDPASYTTTSTGLQFADLVVGTGESAAAGANVSVDYAGWLEDGTLFDASYKRPTPFTFTVGRGQVIKGWDEGVATMKVGGKRQLRVPADLAYGPKGRGKIPPAATLIFDVELVSVAPPRVVPDAPMPVADDGWTKTESGLEFHDHVVGTGEQPVKGKMVHVDYTGWLVDGKQFDSSYSRATPLAFRVGTGQVIKGWDEGLLGMKVGGSRQLRIPYELAYGEAGRPPVIPPSATLIFDVNLVSVD